MWTDRCRGGPLNRKHESKRPERPADPVLVRLPESGECSDHRRQNQESRVYLAAERFKFLVNPSGTPENFRLIRR